MQLSLFISSLYVWREKIQLNAYLIVYFNVSHSVSSTDSVHCYVDKSSLLFIYVETHHIPI